MTNFKLSKLSPNDSDNPWNISSTYLKSSSIIYLLIFEFSNEDKMAVFILSSAKKN